MNILQKGARWGISALTIGIVGGMALAQSAVSKTNNTVGYFDASSGVRSFMITAADMAGGTAVNRVTIDIDFAKVDGEVLGQNPGGTPFYNEIVFTLTNPQSVTTTLIGAGSFNAGSEGFRGVITFDDLASQFVNYDVNSPHAGTFKPTGPNTMGSLLSANGVGTWTLGIQDTVGADHLGFYSATLNLNSGRGQNLTPEVPGSVQAGAALLAIAGMALYKRRKSAA
jgi:hypothetical protein